jgi:hypothetical protein
VVGDASSVERHGASVAVQPADEISTS